MNRVVDIDPSVLEFALTLTPEDRLRQANAAFRLYHTLHQPFARPFVKGFATLDEFFRYQLEQEDAG